MEYQLIGLEIDEGTNTDIWSLFNTRCEAALSAEEECIAVQLRPEMEGGVPLLNWIENWQEQFQKKGKIFYVVSDDPVQIESMELSHPDQDLHYTTSISELEDRIAHTSAPPKKEDDDETVATRDSTENEIYLEDIVSAATTEEKEVILEAGETISIAGEYLCRGCGTRRMWMKGKTVTPCDNPECFEPDKGWKLDFDLF